MDNMTGEEFIQFLADMKSITDLQYAKELIVYSDIDTKIKIKKMSKGMKQKIGLNHCIYARSAYLDFDETNNELRASLFYANEVC